MNILRRKALAGFIDVFCFFRYSSGCGRNEQVPAIGFGPWILRLPCVEKSE